MSTKEHLTEQDLLEFQFKLASDVRAGEIQSHLAGCEQCREELTKLRRKFASLDLLREEIKVSEDLIARVVEQAQRHKGTKAQSITALFISKPVWAGIAAVLLMGLVLLISLPGTKKAQKREDAATPFISTSSNSKEDSSKQEFDKASLKDELSGVRSTTETTPSERLVAQDRNTPETSLGGTAADRSNISAGRGGMGGRSAAGGARGGAAAGASALSATNGTTTTARLEDEQKRSVAEEAPPFAPASAIELVTLPKRDSVQLTIYNSADLTLAREKRNLTLKQGWNWLQFMWANTLIDPTSLSLEPLEQKDKISVQQLVFPARLKELGRWLIHSNVAGKVPFEVTYLTSGLSWRAFYMGTLSEDEKSMKMEGYVRVANNSGDDYENAQTRLIVGQVHILDQIATLAKQQYPYGRPEQGVALDSIRKNLSMMRTDVKDLFLKADEATIMYQDAHVFQPKEIVKEGLSEYFLYTIEGTETIENKWGKRLLSFEANDIKVDSLYKYDEGRWGAQTIRFVKFANDPNHNLGKTPIPDGDVKIYGIADTQGDLTYIGGTGIKYIPVNEEVELNLGTARLVEVKPTLMDYKTENYRFESDGDISGWDEVRTYEIEVRNTRDIAVKVEITRNFPTNFWQLTSNDKYVAINVSKIKFTLDMKPNTKQKLSYILRTYHGNREDFAPQATTTYR